METRERKPLGIRAFRCWEEVEFGTTIVFANSAGEARYIALHSDSIGEGLSFKDIRVRRAPAMDQYYRGYSEMDWFQDDDRVAMVKDGGFRCDPDYLMDIRGECDSCPAKEWCATFQDALAVNEKGWK